jgi:hypothetical protein
MGWKRAWDKQKGLAISFLVFWWRIENIGALEDTFPWPALFIYTYYVAVWFECISAGRKPEDRWVKVLCIKEVSERGAALWVGDKCKERGVA